MVNTAQVIYSANVRLGGGGMGNSLNEMLAGLQQNGLLKQVIVSSVKAAPLPASIITSQGAWGRLQKRLAFYERSGWGDYVANRLFDRWTTRVMQQSEIFESWTGFCLSSMQLAKQRGSHTILGHGSAHPRTQLELINAERQKWGLKLQPETSLVSQLECEFATADTIVIQSRFSERTLLSHHVPAHKLVRIPLGVNIARFHPLASPPPHPFRVLFLGQVTLRKGIQYLLEAWKQLGWRDAELWVVGKVLADSQRMLQHYAQLPGLRLLGHIPDQLTAFHQSHVFVAPSVEDGFGLVVTEAMACGLPVIVSDQTGAADLITSGESGLIVGYNDVSGYIQALEMLRAQPQAAQQMGLRAYETIQQYTWDNYRRALIELHMTILSTRLKG